MPSFVTHEAEEARMAEEDIGRDRRIHEVQLTAVHPAMLAGSVFVLGVVTGLMLKDAVTHVYARSRNRLWHRAIERTVTYDENLPESLGRREPAPHAGQPRFGGTGAMGVSPAVAITSRSEEAQRHD